MANEKENAEQILKCERRIKDLKHEIHINKEIIEKNERDLVLSGWDHEDRSTMNQTIEDLEKENEIYERQLHKLEKELASLKSNPVGGVEFSRQRKISGFVGLFVSNYTR